MASLVGLYRLWARIRKPLVTEWEARNDRPYLSAGKGRGPQTAVWRQAARAEAATGRRQHAGSLLWDLASFFEAVKREPLWHRARRLGFPMTVLKVAMGVYSSVRMLTLGGTLSKPMRADDGVLAGCGFAMALARACVIDPMDVAVDSIGPERPLPATVDMFVDDVAASAGGTSKQVVDRLVNAAEVLQEVIEGPLSCTIEVGKAAVVASSRALADVLHRRFGRLAGPRA